MRIREIAQSRVRYGYRKIRVLLNREGWNVGKCLVYRLYKEEGLALKKRPKRKRKAVRHREERFIATAPNQAWSVDFVADQLQDGTRFRALTTLDVYTRQSVAIEVGQRLKGHQKLRYTNNPTGTQDRSGHDEGLYRRDGQRFVASLSESSEDSPLTIVLLSRGPIGVNYRSLMPSMLTLFVDVLSLEKHRIQKVGRIECTSAIFERDDHTVFESIHIHNLRFGPCFHIGIMSRATRNVGPLIDRTLPIDLLRPFPC
jgi:hypothetical protein